MGKLKELKLQQNIEGTINNWKLKAELNQSISLIYKDYTSSREMLKLKW